MIHTPKLVVATKNDYNLIQNMARFYAYDLTRYCDFISNDWILAANTLSDFIDFKIYFNDPTRKAFLIYVGPNVGGFMLIDQEGITDPNTQCISEFFILARYQNQGIGVSIVHQIWTMMPGRWEVWVMPENERGLRFWHTAIQRFTNGYYSETLKRVYDEANQPHRFILSFDTREKAKSAQPIIRRARHDDLTAMVALSDEKRCDYARVHTPFWCRSSDANEQQYQWFQNLLHKEDVILLVATQQNHIKGFIMGQLVQAPAVYAPGGLTVMVDDFCIDDPIKWCLTGKLLLASLIQDSQAQGAVQTVVVCGHHDQPKRQFLKSNNYRIASEWYVKPHKD